MHQNIGTLIAAIGRKMDVCSIFLQKRKSKLGQCFLVAAEAYFVILLTYVPNLCVSKLYEIGKGIIGNITSIAYHLVILISYRVQTGIDHVFVILSKKAQKLLLISTKDHNTVYRKLRELSGYVRIGNIHGCE